MSNADAIITTYNEPTDMINLTLAACLKQTIPFNKIFLIDDGSMKVPVNTGQLLQNDRIQFIALKKNVGISAARNMALELSHTPFVACLNVDMAIEPLWLSATMELLKKEDGIGAVFTRFSTAKRTRLSSWRMRFHEEHYNKPSGMARFAPGHAVLFKKNVIKEVGGYSPAFKKVEEDFDICLRMRGAGFETYYLNEQLNISYQKDTLDYLAYKDVIRLTGNHLSNIQQKDFFSLATRQFFFRMGRNLLKGRWGFLWIDAAVYFKGFSVFSRLKQQ